MTQQQIKAMTKEGENQSEADIEQRRDDALRRALNTPPRQNKELKKGSRKPQQKPTASRKSGS
jgi:hypothetical protein